MNNPNFTIITSGGCNAKCDFCTDPYNSMAHPQYISKLMEAINTLPSNFNQVSITGGEPTISPDLQAILSLVKFSGKFSKVVFTTNGTKLLQNLDLISDTVNHVNISRHAIGYEDNVKIFKNKQIINDEDLATACFELSKKGVDVNLNHVYIKNSNYDIKYVREYVAYAKQVGASSVSFRYDQEENSLEQTYLEKLFESFKIINQGSCPVCRNHTILVDGFPVVFKASFAEPSNSVDYLYELIYSPTGKLTEDWEGKKIYKKPTPQPKVIEKRIEVPVYRPVGGGCGRSGGC